MALVGWDWVQGQDPFVSFGLALSLLARLLTFSLFAFAGPSTRRSWTGSLEGSKRRNARACRQPQPVDCRGESRCSATSNLCFRNGSVSRCEVLHKHSVVTDLSVRGPTQLCKEGGRGRCKRKRASAYITKHPQRSTTRLPDSPPCASTSARSPSRKRKATHLKILLE